MGFLMHERGGHVLCISVGCSMAACITLLQDDETNLRHRGAVRSLLALASFTGWTSSAALGLDPSRPLGGPLSTAMLLL